MIPAFNVSGVLPPYVGNSPTVEAAMSPYRTTMSALVRRFATSAERIEILLGLIEYRAALRALGFVDGFQWVDGSFVEQVETMRNRPPADVDVVTFARRPALADEDWHKLVQANVSLFDLAQVKARYKCDAYFVDLGKSPVTIVNDTRYWFGLFSHQRDTALWKGMLAVPLDSDDTDAQQLLLQ
jgi:hypothetical protein